MTRRMYYLNVVLLLACGFHATKAFVATTDMPIKKTSSRNRSPLLEPLAAAKSRSPRIGGRNKRKQKTLAKAPADNNEKKSLPWPLLILGLGLLIPKLLFGGNDGTSYYVYQSSSSTTINIDGQVQTNRQESFKTNIPNLRPRVEEYDTSGAFETNLDVFMLQRLDEF